MHYVLLTDNNDGTALVACPDAKTAETVGRAAIYNDGGVSAWELPDSAITDTARVLGILREGGRCIDLADAGLAAAAVQIKADHEKRGTMNEKEKQAALRALPTEQIKLIIARVDEGPEHLKEASPEHPLAGQVRIEGIGNVEVRALRRELASREEG